MIKGHSIAREQTRLVWDLVFLGALLLAIGIYLRMLPFGYASADECFYLNIPYRLIQGDQLFVNEWHVSQLASLMIYPFLKIYLLLVGNTDGIILAFRSIYLLVLTITAVLSYLLLRRHNQFIAVLTSLMFFLFTPFGVKAMSYNTLGLIFVYLMVVVSFAVWKHRTIQYLLIGVLMAMAVLCNPYLIVLYPMALIGVIINTIRKAGADAAHWSDFAMLSAGAAAVLVAFLAFVFSRSSFGDVLESLPYCLTDSAHGGKTLYQYFYPILEFLREHIVYVGSFTLVFVIGMVVARLRKVAFFILIAITMAEVFHLVLFYSELVGYNAVMLPMTLLGIAAFFYTKNRNWRLALRGILPALVYALCLNASSNNGMYVIADACAVSSCLSFFFLYEFLREADGLSKPYFVVLIVIAMVQLGCQGYICTSHIFGDSSLSALTSTIQDGPQAGLRTTVEKAYSYQINYNALISLSAYNGENLLCFQWFPCGYFILDQSPLAGFSAWMADGIENIEDERVTAYYELHPDKNPTVIYVDSYTQSIVSWALEDWQDYCQRNGYTLLPFPEGGLALIREEAAGTPRAGT